MNMNKILKVAVLACSFSLPVFAAEIGEGSKVVTASLVKISDGDTMTFHNSKGQIKCRLYGVDTPEKYKTAKFWKDVEATGMSADEVEEAGQAASNYAKQRLHVNSGYKLSLYNQDKYGRSICVIYLNDNKTFNEKIVEDGYAVVYKNGKYTKDKALRHALNQAQGKAVNNEAGLWRTHKLLMKGMATN